MNKPTKRDLFLYLFVLFLFCALLYSKAQGQTKAELWQYIKASGVIQPEIVYKQAIKETGHLRCTKCSLRYNNLFGFWNGERFLRFDHWRESVDYYKRWQIRKGAAEYKNYYDFLRDRWGAPDMEKYIRTLKITGKIPTG